MSVVYAFDSTGAFIAADTKTRRTVYAYPTSQHAMQAKRAPEKIAAEMVEQENSYGDWRDNKDFRVRDEKRFSGISAKS